MIASKRAFVTSAVICVLLAIGCGRRNEYEAPPPPPVTVVHPLQQTVTNYLEETGTTEAVEMVDIRARVTGFLEQVKFEPGTNIKQGDVLYVIEQRQFKAEVAAAGADLEAKQAALDKAEIEYEREQRMFEENATSERNVVRTKAERDGALATVDAAIAALDRAQLDLDYTEVSTPIDGRVGKTLVKLGNLVDGNEATHLTTVIQYDPIYANFNISERALLQLLAQMPAKDERQTDHSQLKFYLQRADDQGFPFEGQFDYADLAVDQSTGTFAIRGIFPNPNDEIVPGLFVRIRIPIGTQENALLVPEQALASDQAGRYLLTVNSENMVERRNVTAGAKHGNLVVIDEGLRPDDRVIIEGVQRARPGGEVDPQLTELAADDIDSESVETEDTAPPVEETNTPFAEEPTS